MRGADHNFDGQTTIFGLFSLGCEIYRWPISWQLESPWGQLNSKHEQGSIEMDECFLASVSRKQVTRRTESRFSISQCYVSSMFYLAPEKCGSELRLVIWPLEGFQELNIVEDPACCRDP